MEHGVLTLKRSLDTLNIDSNNYQYQRTDTHGEYVNFSTINGEYYLLISTIGAGVADGYGYNVVSGITTQEHTCALILATSNRISVFGGNRRGIIVDLFPIRFK